MRLRPTQSSFSLPVNVDLSILEPVKLAFWLSEAKVDKHDSDMVKSSSVLIDEPGLHCITCASRTSLEL